METLRYTCVQMSPLWFGSLEVVMRKSAQGNFLVMVVMEMLKYTCIASLRSEEVVIGKVPEAIFCSWSSWKHVCYCN